MHPFLFSCALQARCAMPASKLPTYYECLITTMAPNRCQPEMYEDYFEKTAFRFGVGLLSGRVLNATTRRCKGEEGFHAEARRRRDAFLCPLLVFQEKVGIGQGGLLLRRCCCWHGREHKHLFTSFTHAVLRTKPHGPPGRGTWAADVPSRGSFGVKRNDAAVQRGRGVSRRGAEKT